MSTEKNKAEVRAVAVQFSYEAADALMGGSDAANLKDGTSLIAPERCVWLVSVDGPYTPRHGPSNEAREAAAYSTFAVAVDQLSGQYIGLIAGVDAPDLSTGAGIPTVLLD